MANEVQKVKANGLQVFNRTITSDSTQAYLQAVLGERKGSFVNNLTALVTNSAQLQACEPYSVMFAALKATALNLPLDPSIGCAYVIPYKDNKKGVTVAQFQLGYKGFKQLALRTKQFEVIHATDIREGELKTRNRLTGEFVFDFIEDDAQRMQKPIVGYVSYFRLKSGYSATYYMSKEEVEKHALRYSQTYRSSNQYVKQSSKWTTDFDAMALKTVTKLNLSKNAPLNVELADAIQADQSVMQKSEHEYEYIDNRGEEEIDDEKVAKVAAIFSDYEEVGHDEEVKGNSDAK